MHQHVICGYPKIEGISISVLDDSVNFSTKYFVMLDNFHETNRNKQSSNVNDCYYYSYYHTYFKAGPIILKATSTLHIQEKDEINMCSKEDSNLAL